MKKLAEWISIKKIAVAVGFAFFASMVPNWLLAFIARPSGDDYGYSAASHQTWLHTHSVIEVLRTGLETTKQMCQVWNGDWFSVFIFTLMPEVFVYRSFWIVPVFWTLAMIAATYYMVHEVFTNYFGLKWYEGGIAINQNSDKKDKALRFIEYCLSEDVQEYWCGSRSDKGFSGTNEISLPVNNKAFDYAVEVETGEEWDYNEDGEFDEEEKEFSENVDSILGFCKDEIITPEGKKVYWDFLQHKGAAAVIPVMSDGRIIMVRQWRNAIDKYTLEIPAGGKDSIDTDFCT